MAKKRETKKKAESKGHVPLDILEKRLYDLNETVKARGGYSYEGGGGRSKRKGK